MTTNTPAPADLVEAVTDALAKAMYGPDFDPFERPEVHDWASKLAEAAVTTMQACMPREPVAYLQTFKATGEQKLSLRAQDDLPFNRKNWDQVALYATPQPDPRNAELERLREDAEKWRGLMSCQRVRRMGWTHDGNHMGVEFWVKHPAAHPSADYPQEADREGFDAFARAALANSEGKA